MELLGFIALVYLVRKNGFVGAAKILFRMVFKFYAYVLGGTLILILLFILLGALA
jgi:hypothetical protein